MSKLEGMSKYKARKLVSRMAKVLGSLGGQARTKALSPARRKEIARMAGRLGGLQKGINFKARKRNASLLREDT